MGAVPVLAFAWDQLAWPPNHDGLHIDRLHPLILLLLQGVG